MREKYRHDLSELGKYEMSWTIKRDWENKKVYSKRKILLIKWNNRFKKIMKVSFFITW